MSKVYLITLTPIDKFFFGGEITFTRDFQNRNKEEKNLSKEEKELRKFDEESSSYVVESGLYPQQTSLLGMLRYLLLSNADNSIFANNKIQDQAKAKEIIGEGSFKVIEGDYSRMDFKEIKNLSPCFIRKKVLNDWEDLFYAPFDNNLDVEFGEGNVFLNEEKKHIPQIKNYSSKKGITPLYVGNKSILKESDIFKQDVRVGIDRDFYGKTKEGAFYKQISYRFTNQIEEETDTKKEEHKLCFAFYVEVSDSCKFPDKDYVSIGGDNSKFILESQLIENKSTVELTEKFPINTTNFNSFGKLVLLSEAFLDISALSSCMYAISETVPFRFLKSSVTTKDYYKFSGENYLKRSEEKYHLYKRGSVFYFENEKQLNAFEKALKEKERFCQVGYNHYKSIIKK